MSEESYTIKEFLSHSMQDMKETIEEIRDDIKEIKSQTLTTKEEVNDLKNHRAYLWGALSVITVLGGVIISLSVMAIRSQIKEGIAQALIDNVGSVKANE